ncbi:MAG: DNA polymerase III subunit delta' [Planctomycetaceae bacterium]
MSWADVVGHQIQIEMLHEAVRRRRLPHALLFAGPSGIGKQIVARLLAKALLCERTSDDDLHACGTCGSCRSFDAGTHPDCLAVEKPEGKAILPIGLIAGEGDERGRSGLCYNLSLRPMLSGRKVAIVDDADCMNAEAANAFLKTLEEPTPDTIIILISSQPDSLLPTIRSRCQLLRFHPLKSGEVADLLVRLEWVDDPKAAEEIAALSDGSLSQAAQLLDPRWRDLRAMLGKGLSAQAFETGRFAAELLEQMESKASDAGERRIAWSWLLRFAVEYYRKELTELAREFAEFTPTDDSPGGVAACWGKLERVNQLLERCLDEESRRDDNLNISLSLEAWLTDLAQLRRQEPAVR